MVKVHQKCTLNTLNFDFRRCEQTTKLTCYGYLGITYPTTKLCTVNNAKHFFVMIRVSGMAPTSNIVPDIICPYLANCWFYVYFDDIARRHTSTAHSFVTWRLSTYPKYLLWKLIALWDFSLPLGRHHQRGINWWYLAVAGPCVVKTCVLSYVISTILWSKTARNEVVSISWFNFTQQSWP